MPDRYAADTMVYKSATSKHNPHKLETTAIIVSLNPTLPPPDDNTIPCQLVPNRPFYPR